MRKIKQTAQFKRDYKWELKGTFSKKLEKMLLEALEALVMDQPLAIKHRDHRLHGDYIDCRDCHLAPDLVLIYQKIDNHMLILVRLGSHSELFGK